MTAKTQYGAHPASEIFPSMSRAEYEQLKADIGRNGLLEEIIVYQDQILDGRSRYRACNETSVEPRFHEYDRADPINLVLSMNLHRRHLNTSQRAIVAAGLTKTKHGGDRSKAQNCALTHDQAAKQFNISARQVDKAATLLQAEASGRVGASELVAQVRNGEMALNKADKLARPPKEQPGAIVAQADDRTDRMCQLDEMGPEAERLCSRVEVLAEQAEEAGTLTPERRERLVGAWRRARRLLVGDDYQMPFSD